MRWIGDLTPAYSKYAASFLAGFDNWEPVQSNPKLGSILDQVPYPSSLPPPSELALLGIQPSREGPAPPPTLDQLFMLPTCRLSYYKRLYSRLLKSTKEGRSDHQLLVSSNQAILALLDACEEARQRHVSPAEEGNTPSAAATQESPLPELPAEHFEIQPAADLEPEPELEVVAHEEALVDEPEQYDQQAVEDDLQTARLAALSFDEPKGIPAFTTSSASSDRYSNDTNTTAPTSTATLSATLPDRVEDLEHRLNPDRALDIFTMRPKKCRLQIQPSTLAFSRQLRKSGDAVLSFFPLSDPNRREVVIRRAHIFLLTDLFLVCERMTFEEKAAAADDDGEGPDMWLVYPPLAGKHLVAQEVDGAVEVTVMRKEKIMLRFEGPDAQIGDWLHNFRGMAEFGGATVQQPIRSNSLASTNQRQDLMPSVQTTLSPVLPSTGYGFDRASPTGSGSPRTGSPAPISPNDHGPSGYGLPPTPKRSYSTNVVAEDGEVFVPPKRKQSMYFGDRDSRGSAPSPGLPVSPSWQQSDVGGQSRPFLGASRDVSQQSLRSQASYGSLATQAQGQATPTPPPSDYYQMPPPARPRNGSMASHTNQYDPPQATSPRPYPPPLGIGQMPAFAPSASTSTRGPGSEYDFKSFAGSAPPSPNPSFNGPNGPGYGPPPPLQSATGSTFGNQSYSSRSSGSNHSLSGRTDRSSAYPDQPPPLPGKWNHGPGSATGHSPNGGLVPPVPGSSGVARSTSADGQFNLPSARFVENKSGVQSAPGSTYDGRSRAGSSIYGGDGAEYDSPPSSPTQAVPDVTTVVATMRCKVFLQQNHAQWKQLGTAKLKVYLGKPSMSKQLVVESDKSDKKVIISTIILTNGVERVGKTGIAIELSDRGGRTGIVYMLLMKTEQSATGLFDQLLLGSDRKR